MRPTLPTSTTSILLCPGLEKTPPKRTRNISGKNTEKNTEKNTA
jgi:hypothetical protein